MLQACLDAEGKVGLMMNVPRADLNRILAAAARAAKAHHLRAVRSRLGRREHDPRRVARPRAHPATESRRRERHRRVPDQQDHRLTLVGWISRSAPRGNRGSRHAESRDQLGQSARRLRIPRASGRFSGTTSTHGPTISFHAPGSVESASLLDRPVNMNPVTRPQA